MKTTIITTMILGLACVASASVVMTDIGVTHWDFTQSAASSSSGDGYLNDGRYSYVVKNPNKTATGQSITEGKGIVINADAASSKVTTGLTSGEAGLTGGSFTISMSMTKDAGFGGMTNGNFAQQFFGASGGNNQTQGNSIRFGAKADGTLRVEFNSAYAEFGSSTMTNWKEGESLIITMSYDASASDNRLKIYANGSLLTMTLSSNLDKINLNADYGLNFLGDNGSTGGTKGVTLENASVFDQALTGDQIQSLFGNGGKLIPEPSTVTLGLFGLSCLLLRRRRN